MQTVLQLKLISIINVCLILLIRWSQISLHAWINRGTVLSWMLMTDVTSPKQVSRGLSKAEKNTKLVSCKSKEIIINNNQDEEEELPLRRHDKLKKNHTSYVRHLKTANLVMWGINNKLYPLKLGFIMCKTRDRCKASIFVTVVTTALPGHFVLTAAQM